ncbi:glutathione S-transferase N-terminal domain-containing protein [Spirulina sp. CS-785/01]|uniref:glutathione S-transferase family protein n=1 Tax=Spirulina sp. CS-785/01 TaxID=3021716 RepID=UPI002330B8E1|nr:glutathione S-transferase N-terminal domain-containing protein [Spirulina sp. CS-785/01]MDB9311516.1 glutathione S-transferase N-terminal domain-containing protein [Spirulina sp. CS-785/01]
MIDLYTYRTPNGRKPSIFLEEVGLPYTLKKVDLKTGEQFHQDFVAINPNSKIPAIVDHDTGITVFESGAILVYLGEKTGQFLPTSLAERANVMQWLMFQMGNIGPMFGQLGHFRHSAPENIPYGIERYEKESLRLCKVMDQQLASRDFLAGDYSIADIATYPWVAIYEHLQLSIDDCPHLLRWLNRLQERPAVYKGMNILKD